LLHFGEGGDLVAQQRTQCIGAVGEGPHNVIVPTTAVPPDRYYNKSTAGRLPFEEDSQRQPGSAFERLRALADEICDECSL
jgi:hypothetical protein